MTFFMKKLVSAFLLPLPFGLLLIAIGLILLLTDLNRFRNLCFILGFFIVTVFSLSPVAIALLNHLQLQYAPLIHPPKHINKIVVLGGGTGGNKSYPANITLGAASLSRLTEGIRLLKEIQKNNTHATLILSGGRAFLSPSDAGKMKNTAVMLGVDPAHIELESGSQDTRQEAVFLKKELKDKSFILVTSAYHMSRAMQLFEALGMHPIAAPTQFYRSLYVSTPMFYLPNTRSLLLSDTAIHEYLGIIWAKWRGYIQ